MTKKILFVCTGNYYRSRFAEIYFNYFAKLKPLSWEAFSRGFNVDNPNNVGFLSPQAEKTLLLLQIPISCNNPPVKITAQNIKEADMVIALNKKEHGVFVDKYFQNLQNKFIFWDIQDLHELSSQEALVKLKLKIDNLIEKLGV